MTYKEKKIHNKMVDYFFFDFGLADQFLTFANDSVMLELSHIAAWLANLAPTFCFAYNTIFTYKKIDRKRRCTLRTKKPSQNS